MKRASLAHLKRILALTLATSFLLASLASSLHVHWSQETSHEKNGATSVVTVCPCGSHNFPGELDGSSPGSDEHDSDSCLLCKFISDFGYYQVADVAIESSSFVSEYVARVEGLDQREIVSVYRGRAPPVEIVV